MVERKNIASVFRPEENSLRKVFGELEAAMMTYLWQRGQATVSEMYELTTQRDLAYTTVKTVMERVSEKGYLSCNTRQRAYVYTPTQSREAVYAAGEQYNLKRLISRFWRDHRGSFARRDGAPVRS